MPNSTRPLEPVISVVVPLLNEAEVLGQSYAALRRELERLGEPFEIIFVDDGSTDGSPTILRQIAAVDDRVRVVVLSRNFGHEMATTAGLHHAVGQAAVVIDADLQDPPELIHEFVAKWREGYHVVYGVRERREGESLVKKATAFLFYRMMRHLSDIPIPADTGDFRLMDRRVLDVFRDMKDDPRFFRGLIPWIGFRQIGVPFVRRPRAGGRSKYRPARLFRLAYDTLTSFSTYTAHLREPVRPRRRRPQCHAARRRGPARRVRRDFRCPPGAGSRAGSWSSGTCSSSCSPCSASTSSARTA